jgi:hypothetical protein
MKRYALILLALCFAPLLAGSCGNPPSYESPGAPKEDARSKPADAATPPASAPAAVELVEEGFLGQYNIIRAGKRFYALPQDQGAFETDKAERGDYARLFIANDVNRVKTMTQEGVNAGFGPTSTMLVEEGYKSRFNIIRHNGTYYALSQEEGVFDPTTFKGHRGASLQEVKSQIP